MTPTAFLAYCAAVTLAAATPGPAMFAIITNGVSRGFLRAFMAGVGVAAGDAVLVTLALLGLVALAQTFEWIFLLLKYAGAAYLIFLGIRMWRASATQSDESRTAEAKLSRSFWLRNSLLLQMRFEEVSLSQAWVGPASVHALIQEFIRSACVRND